MSQMKSVDLLIDFNGVHGRYDLSSPYPYKMQKWSNIFNSCSTLILCGYT